MDWLVNVAILLVVGSFILGLSQGKIKNNQSGDVLPRYTAQRSKAEIERESQEIIKKELKIGVGFDLLKSKGYTGFLDFYLCLTRDDETLTTTAKSDIVQSLSENDLPRDLKSFIVYICSFILNLINNLKSYEEQ